MEFQSIEYTKCYHRLYTILLQSTILDLVGEPWFQMGSDGLRFYSRSISKNTVSILIMEKDENEAVAFRSYMLTPDLAPIVAEVNSVLSDPTTRRFSSAQKDLILNRRLGDFFRVHYKKFD